MSRYQPPGRGDSRFLPRDRSPPRYNSDRRPYGSYAGPPGPRGSNDHAFRANDAYSHPGSRRDPPRGPKAFSSGLGRGYGSRGRGYRGRGDGIPREYRDTRDGSAGRREQEHRDWDRGTRDSSRERRASPTGRNRSRSPAPRDYRDSRDFTPRDIDLERSRRNSRDGFAQRSPAASDPPLSAGTGNRGGYFGRGRSERDFGRGGRGSLGDDRDSYRARSWSRDRGWERRSLDDRDRDMAQGSIRRDDSGRGPWDDRDRDSGRTTRETFNSRPEPGSTAHSRSGSLSPRPMRRQSQAWSSYDVKKTEAESASRPATISMNPASSQVQERSGASSGYLDRDLPPQRASSPPQAPQVPAFGSVVYQQPPTEQNSQTSVHAGYQPVGAAAQSTPSVANAPSAPKAQLPSNLPTGPKADQASGRRPAPEPQAAANRWSDIRPTDIRPNVIPDSSQAATPDVSLAPGAGEMRYNAAPRDLRPGQNFQQTPIGRSPTFVSSNRPQDDMGRHSSNHPYANAGHAGRPSFRSPSGHASPVSIPRGPRADRTGPPILSPGRVLSGRPTTQPRARGANLSWVNPRIAQHVHRGPSIMGPMAVRKEPADDDTTASLDGDEDEVEPSIAPTSVAQIQPPSSKETSGDQAQLSRETLGSTVEQLSSAIPPQPDRVGPAEPAGKEVGEPEDQDIPMDEHMDWDEEYLADEDKFRRQIQTLEARRPASPRRNAKLLSLLEEIDALASAAEDRASGRANQKGETVSADEPNIDAYPSPRVAEDDPFQENIVPSYDAYERSSTPPIEGLPYLMSGPPTPFSEVDDLIDRNDLQEILDAQLMDELTARLKLERVVHEDVREQYYLNYKAWRLAVEDWEDKKAAGSSVPMMPAPMPPPLMTTTSTAEGRRSARNVSELDFERALRDSAVLASEEQQRREQEAKSSINPDKEAVIPDMLSQYEIETQNLLDTTNLLGPGEVQSVLGYVPKPTNFTPEEQEIYTEAFLTDSKKFGAIAKALPGRSYQDCIRHYYLTKHEQKYKDKLAYRLKRGKKGPPRGGGRPKGAAPTQLLTNSMVDERHQIEVTDTGRPRRAAAPNFGQESIDPDASAPAGTPSRFRGPGARFDGTEHHPEKPPSKRGRGGATKERGSRKPKTQLLAPGPSPQKPEATPSRGKSKELKVENEQQMDDVKAGELLANLQYNQNNPTFTQQTSADAWMASQPMPANDVGQIPRLQYADPEQSQSQQRLGSSTSSYWSVPEQTDFANLLHHFGTNWQGIADYMKTKTQTMVKNYYHRRVEKGDRPMEESANIANAKIQRGEDMGQPPPPTIVTKRRYDTGPQMVPQRPLAPSMEANEAERDSSNLQPPKVAKLSPSQISSGPQKLSALVQAEPVASKLPHENSSQGNVGTPSRSASQAQQQRYIQGTQVPRAGFFNEDRARPTLQPQPPASSQQHQSQFDGRPQKPVLDQPRVQSLQDILHAQDRSLPQDQPSPSARFQQTPQIQQQTVLPQGTTAARHSQAPPQTRIASSQSTDVDIRPRIPHQQLQPQPAFHHDQRQDPHRIDPPVPRRPDAYGTPRQSILQSRPRVPSNASPPQEVARPSSAAPPPQPQQPPKRSNIMSILNDVPAEPQARKIMSDNRPAGPTPPPQSPAGQMYQAPMQQYARREVPPIESQHQMPGYHQRPSIGSMIPQQQPQQVREGSSNWATVAQRTAVERQPGYHQQRAESPRVQAQYAQHGPRTSLQSISRTHAPTPPPSFGHSRSSSFASLPTQQPAQQAQLSSQATPVLQASPYAQIHPQQPMHHHQHQHSQHQHQPSTQQPRQAPVQPQQQQHRGSGPTSLFALQYSRQQEAIQHQQAQQQQQQLQQAEAQRASLQRYENELRMNQARAEQARREEAARRTYTPPVYNRHGGYEPPPDQQSRGYEDRM